MTVHRALVGELFQAIFAWVHSILIREVFVLNVPHQVVSTRTGLLANSTLVLLGLGVEG